MLSLIVSAILSMLPASADHDVEQKRLAPLALAIESAVEQAPALPFEGDADAARLGSALALVAIASHESGFKQAVIDCSKRGAAGDATAFQLLGPMARGPYSVKELCASPLLAAERAVAVLATQAGTATKGVGCPRAPWVAAFQGYASGRCGRPAPIRRRDRAPSGELVIVTLDEDGGMTRCETWEKLAAAAGLRGATCRRRLPLALAPARDGS